MVGGLPSAYDNDTIYVVTDSGETEIEKLIIRGMEFAGGGVPDTGEPMISSPSNGSTINLGNNEGSGVSKTITIKGKNLTGDLTVAVGTGLTISYGQSTGQSSVTIPMAQALLGAQVTVSYGGSGALDNGSLVISHGGSVLSSVVVVVVVVEPATVELKAVQLTGTQWLQTDYNVVANTKVSMRLKFTENANTIAGDNSNKNYYFLTAYTLSSASKQFAFYAYKCSSTESQMLAIVPTTPPTVMNIPTSTFLTDDSLFEVGLQSMKFTPNGGTAITTSIGATQAMDKGPLTIGLYHSSSGTDSIFNWYDLTIYELTITENDVVKRHYTPVTRDGVPGLLDSETGHFMSSKTNTELVAIPLT